MIGTDIIAIFKNLPVQNLDLLSVGITIAAICILGFVIYINDRHSITNKSFLYLAVSSSIWSIFNYVSYQTNSPEFVLWSLRLLMFCAVWFAFSLFQVLYVFPKNEVQFPSWYKFILTPCVFIIMVFTLTPLVFSNIIGKVSVDQVATVQNGLGIIAFGLMVFFLVGGGIILFIRKLLKANTKYQKQAKPVLWGLLITFTAIIILNFILPAFEHNFFFIPLGALFIFPFIAFTSYAIYKHQLFNIRAALVAGLTFILSVAAFIEIIFSTTVSVVILRSAVFILVLAISIMMNRFVQTIAEQREKLSLANAGQQQFIHYLNHESKGYLTDDNVVLSAVRDSEFGPTAPELQKLATTVLRKNRRAVDDIDEMILSADLGTGAVRYTMEPFDLKSEVSAFVDEYRPDAEEKSQKLEFHAEPALDDFTVVGDKRRLLRHALKNYLKNAIVYTPVGGTITVELSKKGTDDAARIVLAVHDSGVGITAEDKARLFTEGGKGIHSTDVNPNSTGRGLYIVKQIIEAHHGRVWADSAGAGKGSTFAFELPAKQK